MANYPYNGGMYGGYSDPANNKKKTIVGPKADNALAQLPATINANPDTGASTVSDAGSMARGLLQKTPGGYPNIGLSTPPAARRSARDMLLNIPGNDGQPAAPPANPLSTMPANIPTIKPGMVKQQTALNSMPQTAPNTNPTARQLLQGSRANNGLNMMPQAGPSFTTQMGTAGQDGYGRLSLTGNLPKPGSTMLNRGVPGQPNAYQVNATSLNKLGDTVGTTRGNGFEFQGKASDAAKFFAPSGMDRNSPEYQRFVEQERRKSNPMESDQEAFTRQSNDLALNNLRGLSGLQQQYLQSTDPAQLNQLGGKIRTMLSKDVSPVDQARIDSERLNQQKGQMEIESLRSVQAARDAFMKNPTPENETRYRGAIGKLDRDAQYGTVARYDDQGMKTGEDLYNKVTGELVRRDDSDRLHQLPKNPKELVPGRIYQTGKGVGMWDGKHFDLRWYDRDAEQPRPPAAPVWPSTGQLMP